MQGFDFLLGSLATWRVAALLATGRWLVVWLAVGGAAALLEHMSAPRETRVVDLSEAERLNEGTG